MTPKTREKWPCRKEAIKRTQEEEAPNKRKEEEEEEEEESPPSTHPPPPTPSPWSESMLITLPMTRTYANETKTRRFSTPPPQKNSVKLGKSLLSIDGSRL